MTMTNIKEKYIPVLDNGFVALVEYMGGDETIERSARVSYGKGTRAVNDRRDLIRYLIRNQHTSVLEQTVMTFHVGLPIVVMRQLIR